MTDIIMHDFLFISQSGRFDKIWREEDLNDDRVVSLFMRLKSNKTNPTFENKYFYGKLSEFADSNPKTSDLKSYKSEDPSGDVIMQLLGLTQVEEEDVLKNESSSSLEILKHFQEVYSFIDRGQELLEIHSASQYDGFNPKKVREKFLNGRTPGHAAFALVKIFIAYAAIGNNARKLSIKRVNLEISKDLMREIGNLDVVRKATQNDSLTLPRIAISFMPEYLIYRSGFSDGLQVQTESSVSVKYQDIVFYGYGAIRGKEGYADFHVEFSKYIFDPKSEEELDLKKFQKDYLRWNKVSIAGIHSDVGMIPRMDEAMKADTSTQEKTYRAIYHNIERYIDNSTYNPRVESS